ncbi:MAG: hypothetical protein LBC18_08890 [Opitutaceae bacterium]|jgi:hypothetical protein|nr:hypothetical protein [Opitutaceae bacterium]
MHTLTLPASLARPASLAKSALLATVCAAALPAFAQPAARADGASLLVEPESFAALDTWQRAGDHIQSGNQPGTAFAGVNVAQPGRYQIWTRTRNYINNQSGRRRLLVKIDDAPAARESGAHNADGWAWEHVGEMQLDAGLRMIEIVDTARNFGRLEAILLTTATALDPNTRQRNSLNTHRVPVVQPRRVFADDAPQPPAPDRNANPLATLGNAGAAIAASIVFRAARTTGGAPRVWREIRSRDAQGRALAIDAGVEPLFLFSSEKNAASFNAFFPVWKTGAQADWTLGGRTMRRAADLRDPWLAAGKTTRLDPVDARPRGDGSVEVEYRSATSPLTVRGTWSLPAGGDAARVEVSHEVADDAWYSFAFACGQPVPRGEVEAVMLPPVYQFRRMPESPELITSSLTPHPYALVGQKAGAATPAITRGIIAAPEFLDGAWAGRANARFGFTLLAPGGDAQAWSFSPILGAAGSQKKRGETLRAAWHLVATPQPWETVMRDADAQIYGVTDYREPVTTSLTGQALNIIDLLADDKAGGWDARLKGPENIESPSTVTHASPLTYLSAALLTQNEKFYAARSLPTIEFLLSRPSAHFALTARDNLYVTDKSAAIDYRHTFFGSAVWQGIDDLTRGLNPWLESYIAAPDGRPRKPNGIAEPEWSGWLALHRAKPGAALLERIRADADGWITRAFHAFETNPALSVSPGIQPFYNVSHYPYWWDLLDLHELTADPRHLDAARLGAAHTIAGLWVAPPVRPGAMTLYPGNKYESNHVVWWKGDAAFRLGWPGELKAHTRTDATFAIPEKQVPAWTVSPAGLGLEQPVTYFSACANGMSNIMLSVWAANLLRLHGQTGDDYYRTFARNTLIGRGANYPGYYLSAHTDIMQDPDYPRTGPDLTSFYWHHAPVHLAMLVDYIVTDADVRTRGAIRFPYSKQQGYVWFSSRIYGGKPGRVFDDAGCRLMLDREKFGVDTPMVDYFGARGKNKFHLVLLNQARGSAAATVTLDREALGIAPGKKPLLRITGDSRSATKPRLATDAQGRHRVTLPARGVAVLSFDAAETEVVPALPRLETRPVIAPLGGPWGELRLFRIRSPFGSDSLYAVMDGRPAAGAAARLEIENAPAQSLASFPYEFTLAGVPMDRDIRVRLHLAEPGAAARTTGWFALPGTTQ